MSLMVMWSCGIYILFLLVPYWVDDYFEVQSLLPNLVWLNMLQKHSADMSLEVRHATTIDLEYSYTTNTS